MVMVDIVHKLLAIKCVITNVPHVRMCSRDQVIGIVRLSLSLSSSPQKRPDLEL